MPAHRSTHFLLITALAAADLAVSPTLAAQADLASERLCKPVVPQFIVRLSSKDIAVDGYDLYIQFDEEGGNPFDRESFTRSPRHAFCTPKADLCVASRARYEVRHEGNRQQSIRIRSNNQGKGNRIIGGVRWHGAAYPDKVRVDCNLDEVDTRKSCVIVGLEYTPNPKTSGRDFSDPSTFFRRHDRCQPKAMSVTA